MSSNIKLKKKKSKTPTLDFLKRAASTRANRPKTRLGKARVTAKRKTKKAFFLKVEKKFYSLLKTQ